MELEERKSRSSVRYDHALECLDAAKSLLENGNDKSAANRSYYAIFHAMRAVLALNEIDMRHYFRVPQALHQDRRVRNPAFADYFRAVRHLN